MFSTCRLSLVKATVLLFTVFLCLSGCSHNRAMMNSSFVGRPKSELVRLKGSPNLIVNNGIEGTIFVYETNPAFSAIPQASISLWEYDCRRRDLFMNNVEYRIDLFYINDSGNVFKYDYDSNYQLRF